MSPRSPIDLHQLVAPLSVDQFLERQWPDRPWASHGPLTRLEPLGSLDALRSVESLCDAYDGDVLVWSLRDRPGPRRYHRDAMSPREALARYREGAMLYFRYVDAVIPEVRAMVRRLELELGVLPGDGYGSVLCSPPGGGAIPHFDPDLTFSVQLRGVKRWSHAPNTHVAAPTASYVCGDDLRDLDDLRDYSGPLPADPPPSTEHVELRPGSVIFMPRGRWHETRVLEESISVSFVMCPQTWADLAADRLRRALLRSERWRGLVLDLRGSPRRRAASLATFDALLDELPRWCRSLRAEHIAEQLERPLGGHDDYRRVPGVVASLAPDPAPGHWRLAVRHGDEERHLVLPTVAVELCRFVLESQGPCTERDFVARAHGVAPRDVWIVVDALVSVGLLERLEPPRSPLAIPEPSRVAGLDQGARA